MKKKIFLVIILFILMLISYNKVVFASDIEEVNCLSQEYLDWLRLPENEKKNTIEPFPINIPFKSKISKNINMSKISTKLKSVVTGESTTPESYDLRKEISVEVKDQKSTDSCWAFSANSALETNLAINHETWNFSERHVEYSTASNFKDGVNEGSLDRKVGDGGNSYGAFAYYFRGDGPILEEDMPFEDNNNEISIYDLPKNIAVKQVENTKFFPEIEKKFNNNTIEFFNSGNSLSNDEVLQIRSEIKNHIMKYGGISALIFFSYSNYNDSTFAYNNSENRSTSHAVTIIGWDDNYSKENFKNKPTSDGAYIVLNTWGTSFGNNGVFYISYEDALIERYLSGVKSVSDIDYDKIYQHDTNKIYGWIKCRYSANVFTAEEDAFLTEIVVGLISNQKCDIYINSNGDDLNIEKLQKIAEGVSLDYGYNTINLDNPIELKKGNKFSIIVVNLDDEDSTSVAIENGDSTTSVVSKPGESFGSEDGKKWQDMYSDSKMRNFIIKAITQSKEKTFNVSDLNGTINNDGTGKAVFTVDTSYVENGKDIDIKIKYIYTNEDVTKKFEINGNKIKGKGAYVTIKPISSIKAGKYIINIKLSEFETITKEILVSGELEERIEVTKSPNKTFYFLKEKLDLTGGEITLIKSDGTSQKVDMTNKDVTSVYDFTNIKPEGIEVIVKYKNQEASFGVVVLDRDNAKAASIKISESPKKVNYKVGEELDLTGLKIIAKYIVDFNDNTGKFEYVLDENANTESNLRKQREDIIDIAELEINGYDNEKVGTQEIIVVYNKKSAKFNITIENEIKEIKIKKFPNKINYLKNEELNLNGMELVKVYQDNTEAIIEVNDSKLKIEGYNPNWLGEEKIKLKYDNLEISFSIYIYENPIESTKYKIEDSYISNILKETKISDFKENITTYTDNVKILDSDTEITETNSLVKTGIVLKVGDIEYTLVITGDINGDGKVKVSDLSFLKKAILGKETLKGAYKKAADLNGDSLLSASDLSRLKKIFIEL